MSRLNKSKAVDVPNKWIETAYNPPSDMNYSYARLGQLMEHYKNDNTIPADTRAKITKWINTPATSFNDITKPPKITSKKAQPKLNRATYNHMRKGLQIHNEIVASTPSAAKIVFTEKQVNQKQNRGIPMNVDIEDIQQRQHQLRFSEVKPFELPTASQQLSKPSLKVKKASGVMGEAIQGSSNPREGS